MPGPKTLIVAAVCSVTAGFCCARLIGPRHPAPQDESAKTTAQRPLHSRSKRGQSPGQVKPTLRKRACCRRGTVPFFEPPVSTAAKAAQSPASGLPHLPSDRPKSAKALIEDASRFADGLIAAFPIKPDCLEVKARLMDWLGKSEEAVKCWEKCLTLEPEYDYACVGLGTTAAAGGDNRKAAEWFGKAVQLNPTSFAAVSGLAEALRNSGREKETVAVLEGAMGRKDPRFVRFLHLRAGLSATGAIGEGPRQLRSGDPEVPEIPGGPLPAGCGLPTPEAAGESQGASGQVARVESRRLGGSQGAEKEL